MSRGIITPPPLNTYLPVIFHNVGRYDYYEVETEHEGEQFTIPIDVTQFLCKPEKYSINNLLYIEFALYMNNWEEVIPFNLYLLSSRDGHLWEPFNSQKIEANIPFVSSSKISLGVYYSSDADEIGFYSTSFDRGSYKVKIEIKRFGEVVVKNI